MAWDRSRPVPWQRLIREWLLYVAVMAVLFIVFFQDDNLVGIFAGLLISGPLYLTFGFVLAKFGYTRKSWKELRSGDRARPSRSDRSATPDDAGDRTVAARPKPAPTSRTGGTQQRPGGRRKRR